MIQLKHPQQVEKGLLTANQMIMAHDPTSYKRHAFISPAPFLSGILLPFSCIVKTIPLLHRKLFNPIKSSHQSTDKFFIHPLTTTASHNGISNSTNTSTPSSPSFPPRSPSRAQKHNPQPPPHQPPKSNQAGPPTAAKPGAPPSPSSKPPAKTGRKLHSLHLLQRQHLRLHHPRPSNLWSRNSNRLSSRTTESQTPTNPLAPRLHCVPIPNTRPFHQAPRPAHRKSGIPTRSHGGNRGS
jgi:hypothetical protein